MRGWRTDGAVPKPLPNSPGARYTDVNTYLFNRTGDLTLQSDWHIYASVNGQDIEMFCRNLATGRWVLTDRVVTMRLNGRMSSTRQSLLVNRRPSTTTEFTCPDFSSLPDGLTFDFDLVEFTKDRMEANVTTPDGKTDRTVLTRVR